MGRRQGFLGSYRIQVLAFLLLLSLAELGAKLDNDFSLVSLLSQSPSRDSGSPGTRLLSPAFFCGVLPPLL